MGAPERGERTDQGPAVPDPQRRRLLDEIFGDVLPDVTRDEQPDAADEPSGAGDEWLRANRPPHHGG